MGNYAEIVLDIEMYGAQLAWSQGAMLPDGTWELVEVQDTMVDDLPVVSDEKVTEYAKGVGTWFQLRITLTPGNEPHIERFDDVRPESLPTSLGLPPTIDDLQNELVIFPRTLDNIPSWMKEQLQADEGDLPYLNMEDDLIIFEGEKTPYEAPFL